MVKAENAHDGERGFARWNRGYVKYKSHANMLDQMMDVIVEDRFDLPDHQKRVVRGIANGKEVQMVFVVNHRKMWIKRDDQEAKLLESAVPVQTEHPFAAFASFAAYLNDDVRLTVVGDATIEQQSTVHISAESDKLGHQDLWFDRNTGLLAKRQRPVPRGNSEKVGIMDAFFNDYKEVEGGMVPMRIRMFVDGEVATDVTLIDVTFSVEFDESTFAKP